VKRTTKELQVSTWQGGRNGLQDVGGGGLVSNTSFYGTTMNLRPLWMFVVNSRKQDGATQKDRHREVNQKGGICRIHVDGKNSSCNIENLINLIHS
jgi:hypothetical protein